MKEKSSEIYFLYIVETCCMHSSCLFLFFFSPHLFSRRRSINTGLLYWAASRYRLFFYWPVSRYVCGREGVSPDLPLPGTEVTDWHGGARVRKEVAERWKVSVMVVVGSEKSSNSRLAAKEVAAAWVRRAGHRETRAALVAAWREGAGSGWGFGEHANEVGIFIAPPAAKFNSKDDQATAVFHHLYVSNGRRSPNFLHLLQISNIH